MSPWFRLSTEEESSNPKRVRRVRFSNRVRYTPVKPTGCKIGKSVLKKSKTPGLWERYVSYFVNKLELLLSYSWFNKNPCDPMENSSEFESIKCDELDLETKSSMRILQEFVQSRYRSTKKQAAKMVVAALQLGVAAGIISKKGRWYKLVTSTNSKSTSSQKSSKRKLVKTRKVKKRRTSSKRIRFCKQRRRRRSSPTRNCQKRRRCRTAPIPIESQRRYFDEDSEEEDNSGQFSTVLGRRNRFCEHSLNSKGCTDCPNEIVYRPRGGSQL